MNAGLNDGRHVIATVRRALINELVACVCVGSMLAGAVAFFAWAMQL